MHPIVPSGPQRLLLRLIALVVLASTTAPARADEPTLRLLSPLPGGDTNFVGVHAARPLSPGKVAIAVHGDYASEPLVSDGGAVDLISHRVTTDLLLAVGLPMGLELGLDVPIVAFQSGLEPSPLAVAPASAGLGDLRLIPKWQLHKDRMGVGVALAAIVTAPTSQAGTYLGERPVSAEGRLIVDVDFTPSWRMAFNTSYAWRPTTVLGTLSIGPEVRYGVAVEGQLAARRFAMMVEVLGSVPANLTTPYELNTLPLEADVGFRGWVSREHAITFGVGLGLIGGYGVPRLHAFLGYSWTAKPALDTDEDGIIDASDRCPYDVEDYDDWEDGDGCPDVDNDYDGIVDRKDNCPNVPEDLDRYQDYDGCPEGVGPRGQGAPAPPNPAPPPVRRAQ